MLVSSPYAAALGRIPVRTGEVAVLGSATRFWDYGDPDAGTTLVLVHGFRGDHHGLEPVVAELDGVRMVSPDLPGFGDSTPMTEAAHDIDGYGRWLRAFVASLGLGGRVVLLGHSFGSIVVSGALAANAGDDRLTPDAVVLVNPIGQPALAGPRGVMTRLAIFYYWLAAALPERLGFALLRSRVIVRVMSVTMAKTKDKALRRWIHDQHDRYFSAFSDRRVVLEAFRASVSHDVSEFAAWVSEPTLLVAAEKDDITPVAAEYRLQTLFPEAELVVIPDVGHLIHYETPGAAARAIDAFLARTGVARGDA
jgi:pimeloyl-ACP methyl ester carboxylesterase